MDVNSDSLMLGVLLAVIILSPGIGIALAARQKSRGRPSLIKPMLTSTSPLLLITAGIGFVYTLIGLVQGNEKTTQFLYLATAFLFIYGLWRIVFKVVGNRMINALPDDAWTREEDEVMASVLKEIDEMEARRKRKKG